MKRKSIFLFTSMMSIIMASVSMGYAQDLKLTLSDHPDTSDWQALFNDNLNNSVYPEGVWTFDDGILTASEDQAIWTSRVYDNYILDLEFKTAEGTNSGVIVYGSDIKDWIPNSIEIQIADDHSEEWSSRPTTWQCAAFFGHKGASESVVKEPGEWNRMTIAVKDQLIAIVLNGQQVNEIDLSKYTSAETNPDGSEIPGWLSKPKAELPTFGHIGLQGKHAGAPIYFRNLKIKTIE